MPIGDRVLQLKISLVGVSKPPVWRRVLVPATMRLDRLHDLIQAVMGWTDTHMHEFTAGGVDFGPRDPELDLVDERKARVGDLIGQARDRMHYTYDFGDYWRHDVLVEKVLPAEARSLPALRRRQGAAASRRLRRRLGLSRSARDAGRSRARRACRHARMAEARNRRGIRSRCL